jgi:transcription antitermination protein NusB
MTPEALRTFAFDSIYLFATPETPQPDAAKTIAALPPEQRDRIIYIATRRLAFQILYQLDAMVTAPDAAAADAFISNCLSHIEGLGPLAVEDIKSLVNGAYDRRKDADAEFLDLAPEWPTNRLAAVDRAILRLGHYEMASRRTHPKIAVNEAVELAKHYSTEKSPAFINGLLDKVLKRLESNAPESTQPAQ